MSLNSRLSESIDRPCCTVAHSGNGSTKDVAFRMLASCGMTRLRDIHSPSGQKSAGCKHIGAVAAMLFTRVLSNENSLSTDLDISIFRAITARPWLSPDSPMKPPGWPGVTLEISTKGDGLGFPFISENINTPNSTYLSIYRPDLIRPDTDQTRNPRPAIQNQKPETRRTRRTFKRSPSESVTCYHIAG